MLDPFFDAQQDEPLIYKKWFDQKFERNKQDDQQKTYCVMMPPPNVTGNLHIGHALTYTIQDILIRYNRMKGADILWQPGVDHAGISTQMMVEKQLLSQGINKNDIGRDSFLKHVWQWKEQYGNQIVEQQKKLGILCDWSRHRFTMDPGLSQAVNKIFIQLYNQGLIYKSKRLVNWDPHLLTAVSDLEVKMVETQGLMTYIRYPFADGDGHITVATTRPETIFGDVAVAVHPQDYRYHHIIGKLVRIPFINRLIPIISDTFVNSEFESGAVKITPAHDFNDFEVGKRHNLECPIIMDIYGRLCSNLPDPFAGQDRFEARKLVLNELKKLNLIEKQVPHLHNIPHGDRSEAVLEPRLTDQWFMNVSQLAKQALAAVENGDITFIPENQRAIFHHWMTNIEPWCISRQLWWGHQIPIWYSDSGEIFCAVNEDQAYKQARELLGSTVILRQDEDVLDTWFSSALWPFSTLGWPDNSEDLKHYYPTAVLITGEDILFFWVARMIMMGLYAVKQVPFKTVFFNPLVRDEKGQKMSKTKGNVIDPLIVINDFGSDALRFALSSLTSSGRDIRFSISYVEQYRNFMTKIWNAAKFCEYNQAQFDREFNLLAVGHPLNQWILSQISITYNSLEAAIDCYRFDEATSIIYRFIKNTFCDWYIEFSKAIFNRESPDDQIETRQTIGFALKAICQLIHPFMPFISEKIWNDCIHDQTMLIAQKWRFSDADFLNECLNPQLNQFFIFLQELITAIRGSRKEFNIPLTLKLSMHIQTEDLYFKASLTKLNSILKKVAYIDTICWVDKKPAIQVIQCVVNNITVYLELGSTVDLDIECQRLQNMYQSIQQEIDKVSGMLNNHDFIKKAPNAVIEKNHNRRNVLEDQLIKIQEAIKSVS